MRIVKSMCAVALLSIVASAQFNTNMETSVTEWQNCVLPTCDPGGTGIPTNTLIAETGSKWPANSLKLSVTGPAYSNFLAYDKVGASTATYLQSDFWVLVPGGVPSSNYQSLEYDIFEYLSPYEFMWGSQCVVGANWQIWDALHHKWLDTTRSCSLLGGGWHHVQWWVHRVEGDTSCEGYPCMYYDMLGVDDVYTQFATTEPAGAIPAGWTNNSGLNFQLDISGVKSKATATEYLQHINLVELGN